MELGKRMLTHTKDEDEVYVYMVYDEENTVVNVYNEYVDAITYCINECNDGTTEEEGTVHVDCLEYTAYISSNKGMYAVIAEPLLVDTTQRC